MCPHKARLLVGVELWLLAGRGLQGERVCTSGVWSGGPIVKSRGPEFRWDTRHKKGTWREVGSEGVGATCVKVSVYNQHCLSY